MKDDQVEPPIIIAAGAVLAILLEIGVTAVIGTYRPPGHTLSGVVHEQPSAIGELLGVLHGLRSN